MPEALPKNHSPSDETGLWFENRGLFSDHFLKARLPEWKEWNAEIDKQPTEVKRMSINPGGEVLEIYSQHEVNKEFYEKECRELLYSCLEGETVANLQTLFDDLGYLEPKIHNYLDEILLRRDYILYGCNLCPGKPRLLR